jgi:hypothetical protein
MKVCNYTDCCDYSEDTKNHCFSLIDIKKCDQHKTNPIVWLKKLWFKIKIFLECL